MTISGNFFIISMYVYMYELHQTEFGYLIAQNFGGNILADGFSKQFGGSNWQIGCFV